MVVVDASVAAKWVLPEADSAAAREFLKDTNLLIAPALIAVEVPGAIIRRYRQGLIDAEDARAANAAWQRIVSQPHFRLMTTEELIPTAMEAALQSRHSLADCLYVAAATQCSAPLVTADRTMVDRCRSICPAITLFGATVGLN